jgi:hypothetical protein
VTGYKKQLKKNTYVFGEMDYIWQDFEKGLNNKYRVSQNQIFKEKQVRHHWGCRVREMMEYLYDFSHNTSTI